MDDRRKTLAATALILGTAAIVVLGIGILVSRSSLISPVPQSDLGSPIKIIFISPSPSSIVTSSGQIPTPSISRSP